MSTAGIFPTWFMLGTASILLTMFAVSYIYDMISAQYTIAAPVYGLVAIIVGSIFGSEAVKGLKK